jgi:hypothetical protein
VVKASAPTAYRAAGQQQNGYGYGYDGGSAPAVAAVTKKRVISFWCFTTGVAMMELQKLGIKSMLLTSGKELVPINCCRERTMGGVWYI